MIPKKIKGYKVTVNNKLRDEKGKSIFGITDGETKTIQINRKKAMKVGGKQELKLTVNHERYHAVHPNAKEKAAYANEGKNAGVIEGKMSKITSHSIKNGHFKYHL